MRKAHLQHCRHLRRSAHPSCAAMMKRRPIDCAAHSKRVEEGEDRTISRRWTGACDCEVIRAWTIRTATLFALHCSIVDSSHPLIAAPSVVVCMPHQRYVKTGLLRIQSRVKITISSIHAAWPLPRSQQREARNRLLSSLLDAHRPLSATLDAIAPSCTSAHAPFDPLSHSHAHSLRSSLDSRAMSLDALLSHASPTQTIHLLHDECLLVAQRKYLLAAFYQQFANIMERCMENRSVRQRVRT
jgi:hypothetical protein